MLYYVEKLIIIVEFNQKRGNLMSQDQERSNRNKQTAML